MHLTRRTAAVLGVALAAGQAQAGGDYPDRPVRLVVPFVPGGSVDILNRAFARALGEQLGQTVVVENRPGGTTAIGTAYVARAAPDGYILLGGSDSVELNRYLMASLPYDPDRDLVPILHLAELIAYGRAHPGQLTYASFGIGGGGHLSGELLCRMARIEALHIPYPGNP